MGTSVDTVVRFYDALGRGDVPAVLGLMDRQVEWTEAERFPYYSGTWHGPDAVLSNLLVPLSRDWAGFSARAHEYVAEGERVVAFGEYAGTFKRTGRHMKAPFAHRWTIKKGKIASFTMYTDTTLVLDALSDSQTNAPGRQTALTHKTEPA